MTISAKARASLRKLADAPSVQSPTASASVQTHLNLQAPDTCTNPATRPPGRTKAPAHPHSAPGCLHRSCAATASLRARIQRRSPTNSATSQLPPSSAQIPAPAPQSPSAITMADMTPEMAFLQSLQSDVAAAFGNGGELQQQQQQDEPQQDDPQQAAPAEDDDEDYDPSALMPDTSAYDPSAPPMPQQPEQSTPTPSQPASQAPSRTASAIPDQKTQAKPPRTMGGFVVDDEDDEDESPVAKAAGAQGVKVSAPGSTHTPERSVSQTPVNALPSSSNVPIHKAAQDQGVSGVSNGAQSALPADSAASVNPSSQTFAAAQPPSSKARLPQDRIGILEDRIQEDTRGDLDAWLNLLGEYRRRDKLDEARAVYARFFKVFPHAVSLADPSKSASD